MPTYDYSCRSCGKVFEQTHGFNDSPSPCVCGSSDLSIIIHPPTVFVKGEATTIGQLSERNTKQMGRYELEDKRREQNKGNNKKISLMRHLRTKKLRLIKQSLVLN